MNSIEQRLLKDTMGGFIFTPLINAAIDLYEKITGGDHGFDGPG